MIGAYHRCVAETVARFDGFVAKYMGDGVLVYFGYPQAHEDDAERAVRAGLALVEAVGQPPGRRSALRVRVGIATGLVVVGDLIGGGAAQEQAVVGETPNLAARLQALAEPERVVIAAATRRLTRRAVRVRDLGAVEAQGLCRAGAGVAGPRRERGREPVRGAARGSALTPLVGREEELELLLRRWEQAKSGEGQVVLLSGEPGIGKSRHHRRAAGAARRRAAHSPALFLLAASPGQRASTRSSPSSNGPPGSRATIRRDASSTSWRRCSRGRAVRTRTSHSWPSCCRSRRRDRYPPPELTPQRKQGADVRGAAAAARRSRAANSRC